MTVFFVKTFFSLLLVLPLYHLAAQNTPAIDSPTIRNVVSQIESGQASNLIDFWNEIERDGAPLIEALPENSTNLLVTFVYKESQARRVRLGSQLVALQIEGLETDFDRLGKMTRLPETDLWYLSLTVPLDVRAPYQFEIWRDDAANSKPKTELDPYNKKVLWAGSQFAQSVLELPKAEPQPWVSERSGIKKGEWTKLNVPSKALGTEQTIWVYTPASYSSANAKPLNVLIGLGITTFRYAMPTATILDNLTESGEISPTILIVADDGGEESAQHTYNPTVAFITDELLLKLREKYDFTEEASGIVIAGTSRRGLVASYVGLELPDVVGNVISLSGSYYWSPPDYPEYEWLANIFSERDKASLRLYLAAGRLETVVTPRNKGHYMLATNRHMRNVLKAKGYDFEYVEFGGVHHELNWRGELAKGLIYLLGEK